jgi:hypothetical protein
MDRRREERGNRKIKRSERQKGVEKHLSALPDLLIFLFFSSPSPLGRRALK